MDGAASVGIDGALVTYVKPAVGNDPAGFFLQATQTGPAIFIAVSPSTLTPAPAVGDSVSLLVTTMGTAGGLRQATAVSNFTRLSSGNAVTSLIQNVSSVVGLAAAVDTYESELISINGTLVAPYASSGTAHSAAQLNTAGESGNAALKLRTPDTLKDSLDLVAGCAVGVTGTPMWRFTTTAQPSAWLASEVAITACPAPTVLSATAVSSTSVVVNFDRRIAPASVLASGSQFTFTNGLTASAAATSARQVTLTTGAQTGGQSYTVTVANTVTDNQPLGVAAPGTATFTGFQQPASLVINEVNPNIASSRDLIELLVTSGGSLANITLEQDITNAVVLATLPSINVATGDLIVIHLAPIAGDTTETTTKGACATTTCYANAWDVMGGTTGITFSNRLLIVRAATGILDAAPFVTTSTLTSFPGQLQQLQAAGQWLPANCGGVLCTYASTPTAPAISVDWAGAGTTAVGNSIQRAPSADTNLKADWKAPAASTFGAVNP